MRFRQPELFDDCIPRPRRLNAKSVSPCRARIVADVDRRDRLAVPASPLDHGLGDVNAPFVLVQYGDYASEHSAEAFFIAEEVRRWLEPRLRLVYRHCTDVRIASLSRLAAEAAEAAAMQERFWQMHRRIIASPTAIDLATMLGYAAALELDGAKFMSDLRTGAGLAALAHHWDNSQQNGIVSAPALFLNGYRYAGDLDADELIETLDALGNDR
jgi:protein-disulfide isomerase